ncbi:MAG: cell envelope biogenesis protein TolA [Synergistaceae bacterium]|nr:cell envelope biogenesis protein TolA [Synergistaceae bacterium]
MAESMADEIRMKEAEAKEFIASAKREAAKISASARTAAELSIKETRQKSHRDFREQVRQAEAEAEAKAVEIVEKGRMAADEFYASSKNKVASEADWLVKEVMSGYGN